MQFNFNSFSPCEEAAQTFLSQSEPSQYIKLATLIDDKAGAEISAFRNFLSKFLLEDEEQERGFVAPPSTPSLIREALSLAKRHLFLDVGDSALPQLLDSQKWLLKNAFAKGTLLHYACAGDQLEVVNYLLQVAKNSSTMVNNAGHSAEYYSENDSIKEAIWNCDMVCAMPVIQPKSTRLLSRASRRSTRASLDESAISKLIIPTTAVDDRITSNPGTAADPAAVQSVLPPTEETQQPSSTPRGKARRSNSLIVLLKRKSDNDATAAPSKPTLEGNLNPIAVVDAVDLNPKQIVKSAMEKPLLERPMDNMLIRVISKLTPIETIAAEMQLNINVDPEEMPTMEEVFATVAAEKSSNCAGHETPSQSTVSTLDRLFQTIVRDEKEHPQSWSSRSRSASAPRSARDEETITVRSASTSHRADSARNGGSSRSVSAPRSATVGSKSSPFRGAGTSKSAGSSRSASASRSVSSPRSGATDSKSFAARGQGSKRSVESSSRSGSASRIVSAPRSSSDSKSAAPRGSDSIRRPASRAATPVKTAAPSSSSSVSAPRHRSDPKILSPPNNASAPRSTSVSRSGGSREQRSSPGDYHELSFREMIWRRAALFINEPATTMVPSPIFADEHLPRGRRAHDTITPGALRSKSVDRLPAGWREERNQRRMQQLICMQLRQEKEATIRQGIHLMRKEFQDLADVDEWPALRPKEKIKNAFMDMM